MDLCLPLIPNLKNGPIPKLRDPPIIEIGNSIMQTQKLTKRENTMGNLYKKLSLPVKEYKQC